MPVAADNSRLLSYEDALNSIDYIGKEEQKIKNNDSDHPKNEIDKKFIITTVSQSLLDNYYLSKNLNNEAIEKKNISGRKLILYDNIEYSNPHNYLKGCKWAPDGSCIVTNCEERELNIYNLPSEIWDGNYSSKQIASVIKIKEVDAIFDYCWNPLMNSWDQQTCFIASTCRDSPIHLWDANTGSLLNTYKAYSQNEELLTCCSLAFNSYGTKLFAGYNKHIRIFDTHNPFSKYETIKTHSQHGLISCFAMSPFHPNLFAVGSYTSSIGIYARPDNSLVSLLHGAQGGITHLIFSKDGSKLYSGGRKDPCITCWDLRNMGKVCQTYCRPVNNNQRVYFDIDSQLKYLVSGLMNGHVKFWDISPGSEKKEDILLDFKAHTDCVNGVSIHPSLALLATSSGRRHISCQSLTRKSKPLNNKDELLNSSNDSTDTDDTLSEMEDGAIDFNFIEDENRNCFKIWNVSLLNSDNE
ncbi:unnamed protein product [Gordionus sp. m RMFG-2023]